MFFIPEYNRYSDRKNNYRTKEIDKWQQLNYLEYLIYL